MSAKDKFHEQVKRALIKDRWTVTDDPSEVTSEGRTFIVDLGAECLIEGWRRLRSRSRVFSVLQRLPVLWSVGTIFNLSIGTGARRSRSSFLLGGS